jgi:phosphinothricin acetyltransferase
MVIIWCAILFFLCISRKLIIGQPAFQPPDADFAQIPPIHGRNRVDYCQCADEAFYREAYRAKGETMLPEIRVAKSSDAEMIAAIYAPIVRDTTISFEVEPPTPQEMAQRIAKTLQTHPWLVAEREEQIIGYAYAGTHRDRAAYRWSVDVSAYVAEGARGQGVGRALYERLIAILKAQGFHSAYAGIALPNAASVGLHEAVGFKPLGIYKEVGFKHGEWRDAGWWRLALSDAGGTPSEPIPFGDLR